MSLIHRSEKTEITDRQIRDYLLSHVRLGIRTSKVRILRTGKVNAYGPHRRRDGQLQHGWFFACMRDDFAEKIALSRLDERTA
jgi:hypothetical protein